MKKGRNFSHEIAIFLEEFEKDYKFKKDFFFAKVKYCNFQTFQASTHKDSLSVKEIFFLHFSRSLINFKVFVVCQRILFRSSK